MKQGTITKKNPNVHFFSNDLLANKLSMMNIKISNANLSFIFLQFPSKQTEKKERCKMGIEGLRKKITCCRALRASAMATLVMLAGILLFLQRAWSSFLERLWKSITQNSQNKVFWVVEDLDAKEERVEAMRQEGNGWRGICKRDVEETLGKVTVGAWNLNFEFGLGLEGVFGD